MKAITTVAANSNRCRQKRKKVDFLCEKVSDVKLVSLHSSVNYLGTFNSRTKTNGVTSLFVFFQAQEPREQGVKKVQKQWDGSLI